MARLATFGRIPSPARRGRRRKPACVCSCPDVFGVSWTPGEGPGFTITGLPSRFNGMTPGVVAYSDATPVPGSADGPVAMGSVDVTLDDALTGGPSLLMTLVFAGEKCAIVCGVVTGA